MADPTYEFHRLKIHSGKSKSHNDKDPSDGATMPSQEDNKSQGEETKLIQGGESSNSATTPSEEGNTSFKSHRNEEPSNSASAPSREDHKKPSEEAKVVQDGGSSERATTPSQEDKKRPGEEARVNQDDDDSDSEDEAERFAEVISAMRLDRLSDYASTVRQKLQSNYAAETPATIGEPIFGSYHVVYTVDFNDGVRWAFKVPVKGTRDKFDDFRANRLRSEALTMQLLKRETTIPLPEVYSFSASIDNELNCPFILMQFMPGKSVYEVWFDRSTDQATLYARRTRVLEGIAAAVLQLDKFSFDKSGLIDFDAAGQPIGTMAIFRALQADGPDETDICYSSGPHSTPLSFFTSDLDHRPESTDLDTRGHRKLLCLFLSWIPEPRDGRQPFVLEHPDLNHQNVLVSDDGELLALIDWDGAGAVPRSVGNERYPSWLTRDWDPVMYGYVKEMEEVEGFEPVGVWEDSPEQLARWRGVYTRCVAKCMRAREGSEGEMNAIRNRQVQSEKEPGRSEKNPTEDEKRLDESEEELDENKRQTRLTRNSLVAENLCIAAMDLRLSATIMEKVFDEVAELIKPRMSTSEVSNRRDLEDFVEWQIQDALDAGTLDEVLLGYLKDGFRELCPELD